MKNKLSIIGLFCFIISTTQSYAIDPDENLKRITAATHKIIDENLDCASLNLFLMNYSKINNETTDAYNKYKQAALTHLSISTSLGGTIGKSEKEIIQQFDDNTATLHKEILVNKDKDKDKYVELKNRCDYILNNLEAYKDEMNKTFGIE